MDEAKYKYEVAFSFLEEDENLATELYNLLSDRFSTFLYSKKQKDLAGTDGEKMFNKVFGEESRIVVVLYRDNWGKTAWTRIEENAIRDRGHDEGYEFTLFIPLDKNKKTPKWLPKRHIWQNLDRWGVKGTASVIESCIQREGGISRPETIHDLAARIKRQKEAEEKRKQFLNSTEGVNCAKENVKKIFDIIQVQLGKIPFEVRKLLDENPNNELRLYFICEGIAIEIKWKGCYTNSLENSMLSVLMTTGPPEIQEGFKIVLSNKLSEKTFFFTTDYDEKPCWQPDGSTDLLSNEQLAEDCIKMLLNRIQEKYNT